jgi:hypothetical protein
MWTITSTHDCNCEGISNHLLNEKIPKTLFVMQVRSIF